MTNLTAGDATTLAQLVEQVFGKDTPPSVRSSALHELRYNLRTIWRSIDTPQEDDGLFRHDGRRTRGLFGLGKCNQQQEGAKAHHHRSAEGQSGWQRFCIHLYFHTVANIIYAQAETIWL